MKHKIRFKNLKDELAIPVGIAANELGLDISADADIAVTLCEGNGLSVQGTKNDIKVTYGRRCELFRALSFLPAFIEDGAPLTEKGNVEMLCYMTDMSRNAVYNTETAKKVILQLALCGYDSLMLYTEDTYELEEYPYFGYMRGRFTKKELRELDDYAYSFGIELIPCIQTLAHLDSALRWGAFKEILDIDDILLVGEEKTYEFIKTELETCRECFRSNRINIGMDEAKRIGLGKYLQKNGYRSKPEIMLEHLNIVTKMCEQYGYEPMIWSDMFFRMQFNGVYRVKEGRIPESVRKGVPKNVKLVYWDYYTQDTETFEHMVNCHFEFDNPIIFSGGLSKWYGFAPLNLYTIEALKMQLRVCAERGINSIIITAWGNDGAEASHFSVLPSLLYSADRIYQGKELSAEWLNKRCTHCFGISYDELMLLDAPNEVGEKYFNANVVINPSKYLLYNDLLTGLLDMNMDPDTVADSFRKNAERLKPLTKHERYGYMYETLYRLCDMLISKSDMSVRIRRAYKENKLDILKEIAENEIPELTKKLDEFIIVFRYQWLRENKPFGFDIQEERIGGLRMRCLSAAERIKAYISGSIDKIDELEEEQLLFMKGVAEGNPYCRHIVHNEYVSVNKIAH